MGRYIKERCDCALRYVQLLSGITLLMYAVLTVAFPVGAGCARVVDATFNLVAFPPVWISIVGVVGFLQIICSRTESAVFHTLASYPAGVAFMFAAFGGTLLHPVFNPLLWFAFMWGVLNWTVVFHSGKKVRRE